MTAESYLRCRHSRLFVLYPLTFLLFLVCASFSGVNVSALRPSNTAEVMQLREFVSGYAQNFVGVRYRHAGTSPRQGFDCSGFTSYILKEFDIKVSSCSATQSKQGEKIGFDEVLPGDLVFFGRKGRVTHVALVVERTDEGIFCVHSTCSRGVIVENISTSKYWKPKMMFARDVVTTQMVEKAPEQATSEQATPVTPPATPEQTINR